MQINIDMSELTNEQEAEKLAKKIKRCLDSIPDKFTVVITNSTIQVCCKDEFEEYFQKEGDIDNPPSIAYETFNRGNVCGCDSQL